MNFTDSVENIKTFFLEILGFFIPGLVFIILFVNFTKEIFSIFDIRNYIEQYSFLFFIFCYVVGYIIYGFGEFINKFKFILAFIDRVLYLDTNLKERVEQSDSFKMVKEKLKSSSYVLSEGVNYREVRNIIMSYIPEVDKKIYAFTFRAELSQKTSYSLLILSIIGFFSAIVDSINFKGFLGIFKTGSDFFAVYIACLISACLLRYTRERFYSISMRIAFPIFLAKVTKIDD